MIELDDLMKTTNGKGLYREAVKVQSPGSRSAAWVGDRLKNLFTPTALHKPRCNPVGVDGVSEFYHFGVERLRRK